MRLILIILLGSAYLTYLGYDGLKGDFDLKTISLKDIESEGIGDSRYIEVTNCYLLGDFVYEYDEKSPSTITNIIFPIVNKDAYLDFSEDFSLELGEEKSEKQASTILIVKRNKEKFNPNCGTDSTCLDDLWSVENYAESGFSIKGVSLLGLDELDEKTRNLILSLDYDLDLNVLYLEEDAEPQGFFMSFLKMIGGISGIIGVLYYMMKSNMNA